ncbi:hypothetical protein NM208_g5880 [Fusarium decemcellulare]|uniref:Uncharacterized protein n=1 Tax=Fusarium decemcellulare TaxID=57161 RepID=A0ACC1SF96_9HYPO|nr:hypothetical protein NM208_g5880 [Fusarium decemcellulare]
MPIEKPAVKRQVRTEAQLNRKRFTDRVKHRENRQDHQARMNRIEESISHILHDLRAISTQLQTSNSLIAQTRPEPSLMDDTSEHSLVDDTSEHTTTSHGSMSFLNREFALDSFLSSSFSDWPILPNPESPSLSIYRPTPPLIDCRCGVHHSSQTDCLEYCSFTVLYETHSAFPQDPYRARSIPRNPSLSDLTFPATCKNPVVRFLSAFIRGFKLKNPETMFGIYFFGYRLMRWRLNPDPASREDVPLWLLPTEVQKTVPHPVSIDYIPWPKLRDVLCLNQNKDNRHTVKLYLESLRLNWPPGISLLCMDEKRRANFSPDLERITFDLQNWELGPPWTDCFPHLTRFASL